MFFKLNFIYCADLFLIIKDYRSRLGFNDIFIDCQPVQTPGAESDDPAKKKTAPKGFDSLFKSPALAVVLGIALITLLKKIYGAFLDLI